MAGGDTGIRPGIIGGALNVWGLRRVVVTGCLEELHPAVFRYLAAAIERGACGRDWTGGGEIAPRTADGGFGGNGD